MSPWTNHHNFHQPQNLSFFEFAGKQNPLLLETKPSTQKKYLYKYLSGLGCKTIVVEPNYFDRDYLSEFSEFYSTSAKGYSNLCQRFHFFNEDVTESVLLKAFSEKDTEAKLSDSYLGFSVIRPIPHAPIGRTVVKWFDDQSPDFPRIKAIRTYRVHLGALELRVDGLAWQQQDGAVGACATIALWSAIHSAAFDENHYIPTTAEITKLAHKTASQGGRVFPTSGLNNAQLLEAIKELGLAPILEVGDNKDGTFSPGRFSFLCTTYIRSGFPIILGGEHEGSRIGHAVCLTGFREPGLEPVKANSVAFRGSAVNTLYIHDDNLGPNVRFAVNVESNGALCAKYEFVTVKAQAPPGTKYNGSGIPDPTTSYRKFFPKRMRIAIAGEIRLSIETMKEYGGAIAKILCNTYNDVLAKTDKSAAPVGFHLGVQYIRLSDYGGTVLKNALGKSSNTLLGRVRLELLQKLPPMSLFLGVVRLWYKDEPLLDILFDTSENEHNLSAFATTCYSEQISGLLRAITKSHPGLGDFLGVRIDAFDSSHSS